jgi:DNA-binding CsgD family transcriptional regulator
MTSRGYSEDVAELTLAHRDVLGGAARGETELETAHRRGVSVSTVKTIRSSAIARLHARNVVEAVAIAVRRGDL